MRSRLNQGLLSVTQLSLDRNSNGVVLKPDELYIPTIRGSYGNVYLSSNSFYNTLVNTVVANEIVIFVNQALGNDNNSGLSAYTAVATMDKAHDLRFNTYTSFNCKIVVFAGDYTVTPRVLGTTTGASFILSDLGTGYTKYICQPGRVTLNMTATTAQRDAPIAYFNNANSEIYGAILKRNNSGKTGTFSVAFLNNSSSKCIGKFYNCVFEETNANFNWTMSYDNSLNMTATVNNCTFGTKEVSGIDYSSTSTFTINDSVFNWTYSTTAPTSGVLPTYNNPVVLASHDLNFTTYAAPGVTSAGVYSGNYAWPT